VYAFLAFKHCNKNSEFNSCCSVHGKYSATRQSFDKYHGVHNITLDRNTRCRQHMLISSDVKKNICRISRMSFVESSVESGDLCRSTIYWLASPSNIKENCNRRRRRHRRCRRALLLSKCEDTVRLRYAVWGNINVFFMFYFTITSWVISRKNACERHSHC